MIFEKFQSLTHKIDTMIIRDIKRAMPLKYWSFKLAEWIARIGVIGFVCSFITYFVVSTIMQYHGESLPEPYAEGFPKVTVTLLTIAILAVFIRAGLYTELEKRIMYKWRSFIE